MLALLYVVYAYWVEYSDFGKAHYDVLSNTRLPLMLLITAFLYFDESVPSTDCIVNQTAIQRLSAADGACLSLKE